jgi:hypothetical protein
MRSKNGMAEPALHAVIQMLVLVIRGASSPLFNQCHDT